MCLHSFSSCSRWLATGWRLHGTGPLLLRLYGWQNGGWQTQTLLPAPDTPVTKFLFASHAPDRLLNVHGPDAFVWRRVPDSGHWCAQELYSLPLACDKHTLLPMQSGDLISLFFWQRPAEGCLMLTSDSLITQQSWQPRYTQHYWREPAVVTWVLKKNLVALCFNTACTQPANQPRKPPSIYRSSVLLWGKALNTAGREDWSAQLYTLSCRPAPLLELQFSPEARHMLGLRENRQLSLWQLDTHNRILLLQLELPCFVPSPTTALSEYAPFRNDGRQLVVPRSPCQMQLWNLSEDDQWLGGSTLETPPTLEQHANPDVLKIKFSPDGKILARETGRAWAIWHMNTDGQWHLLMQRQKKRVHCPQLLLPELSAVIATIAEGIQTRLVLHAPDQYGQLSW
ncbi:MAG: hypothetical protein OXC07_03665 [Kistimonas sp.]|nr:hypothetical protein [Kistimonas sp.]